MEAVTAEAVAAGAYGSSTTRYIQDATRAIPAGASLKVVRVRDYRFGSKPQSTAAATVAAAAAAAAMAAKAAGTTAAMKAAIASKSKKPPTKAVAAAAKAAAAVAAAAAAVAAAGASGRMVDGGSSLTPLKESGATGVVVGASAAVRGFREYPQAFDVTGRRLCIHCMVPVSDCR